MEQGWIHSPCIRNTQCVIYTVSLSLWAFFFGAEPRKTLLERQSRDKGDGSYTNSYPPRESQHEIQTREQHKTQTECKHTG